LPARRTAKEGLVRQASYAAFLRGVTPMNVKMTDLKTCFESAGFAEVRTVLASGNVVFTSADPQSALELKIEAAMAQHLDRTFTTFVRPISQLRALLTSNPYDGYKIPPGSKRVVTLLRKKPSAKLTLPAAVDGARIVCVRGREAFSAYVPGPKGPVFMRLIESTFGDAVTTRTWDTLEKVVRAVAG
jgi:uncharacterized protein (DUF1697 family)